MAHEANDSITFCVTVVDNSAQPQTILTAEDAFFDTWLHSEQLQTIEALSSGQMVDIQRDANHRAHQSKHKPFRRDLA